MVFVPLNESHAILEVVFVLRFARPFTEAELNEAYLNHGRWSDELPKATRGLALPEELARHLPPNSNKTAQFPGAPVSFDSFKRDGSYDWRLRIEGSLVIVNCLTYTRWSEVWPRAKRLFADITSISVGESNKLTGASMHYIDIFQWNGDVAKYSISELLKVDNGLIPQNLWNTGPLWHLHTGHYRQDGLPTPGRLLERTHLDATEQDRRDYIVKIDSTLQLDIIPPIDDIAGIFEGDDAVVDKLFGFLHEDSKQLIRTLLTDEMARRIGLI